MGTLRAVAPEGRSEVSRLTKTATEKIMSTNTESRVLKIVTWKLGMPDGEVELDSSRHGLGMDYLDDVEMVMAVEEEFDIELPDDQLEPLRTVRDIVKLVESKLPKQ